MTSCRVWFYHIYSQHFYLFFLLRKISSFWHLKELCSLQISPRIFLSNVFSFPRVSLLQKRKAQSNPVHRSISTSFGLSAFMTAEAIRIPSAPNSNAFLTSSPLTIPAPHRTGILSIFKTCSIVFVITCGFAFVTLLPDPISSGGSTAI